MCNVFTIHDYGGLTETCVSPQIVFPTHIPIYSNAYFLACTSRHTVICQWPRKDAQHKGEDTWSCVSIQERCTAHSVLFIGNVKLSI